jgi:glycosyltransferase involved in cell wall biosynthesis
MRLLIVISSSAVGGAERRLAEMLPVLRSRGAEVVVASLVSNPPSVVSNEAGSSMHCVDGVFALRRLARKFRPVAVLTYGRRALYSYLCSTFFSPTCPGATVMQTGLDHNRRSTIFSFVIRRRGLVPMVISNSTQAQNLVVGTYGVAPERALRLASAISESWMSPIPQREVVGFATVAIVANGRPEKNLSTAFSAYKVVAETLPVRLTVYAADCTMHRQIADQMGISGVEFTEGKTLSASDFDGIDILLHPSISESLSRSVLEALSRGVIVVTGDAAEFEGLPQPHQILDDTSVSATTAALLAAVREVMSCSWRKQRPEGVEFNSTDLYVQILIGSVAAVES